MQKLSSTAVLNASLPFLDWYLIPESYSAPLIQDLLKEFEVKRGETVLDPFCGAGTTAIYSSSVGKNAVGVEVNPFLAFATEVKGRWEYDAQSLRRDCERVISEAEEFLVPTNSQLRLFRLVGRAPHNGARTAPPLPPPPNMPRLYRWISPKVVDKVLLLKSLILEVESERHRDFLRLALAAILRPVSNMKLTPHAFGSRVERADAPVLEAFAAKVGKMLADVEAVGNGVERGRINVVNKDARGIESADSELLPAKLAATSPPYLNNLDYTMQTRLELFFLDFIHNMKELTALRRKMVICDAKAMYRDVRDHELVTEVPQIATVVRLLDEKLGHRGWGWDYAFMTAQYFGGLLRVLNTVKKVLKSGGHYVMVVGDSAHSGVPVPVCEIVGLLGKMAGYQLMETRVLRERRSSSHQFTLRECAVIFRNR